MLRNLPETLEEYQNLYSSAENTERLSLWENRPKYEVVDPFKFRGRARPVNIASSRYPLVNTDLQPQASCRLFEADVEEYYTNPIVYLTVLLGRYIWIFRNALEDTPLLDSFPIYLGSEWELTLTGMKQKYFSAIDPQLEYEPLLCEKSDLNSLDPPRFRGNPHMDIAFRFYEDLLELTRDTILSPIFPEWWISPFAYMIPIRGHEQILVDYLLDNSFFHEMMRFSVEARKSWVSERARYTGIEIQKAIIRDDEVSPPMVSAKMYEEHILPYERDLASFHGGISYWHGCGDNTDIFRFVRDLNPDLVHVSPWSDLETAAEVFKGTETAFEVSVSQEESVQSAGVQDVDIEEYVKMVCSTLQGRVDAWYFNCGSLRWMGKNIEDDLAKMKNWFRIAREAGRG